jgi:hypothetical protein
VGRAARARKDHFRFARRNCGRRQAHLDMLVSHESHAGASMDPATPILPEERPMSNHERMEQPTSLARLFGGVPIPLALLTQLTRTTAANTGGIHQPQAPISLLPTLLKRECAACWTAQSPIGLERKIGSREATRFPGRGRGGWAISGSRSSRTRGSLRVLLPDGRSNLGDAQGCRFQLMPQFEPQVPDPLRHPLPAFLSPGRMTAPPVRFLLAVFI